MKKYIILTTITLILFTLVGCTLTNQKELSSNINKQYNSSNDDNTSELSQSDKDFINNTIAYIKKGITDGKSGAQYKWSESFLDNTNFENIFEDYKSKQKNIDEESFAMYASQNVPENSNWKTLFEKDIKNDINMIPTKYESLGDDLYEVYVEIEGNERPYMVVNSRTGWSHG